MNIQAITLEALAYLKGIFQWENDPIINFKDVYYSELMSKEPAIWVKFNFRIPEKNIGGELSFNLTGGIHSMTINQLKPE